MDIQCGDQVYYRGEVWTVGKVVEGVVGGAVARIYQGDERHSTKALIKPLADLERVEQVR